MNAQKQRARPARSSFPLWLSLCAAVVSAVHAQTPSADSFNPGTAASYPYVPSVYSLVVQADAKILVGGGFFELGGQSRSCIGRLNADGTVDTDFNPRAGGDGSYAPWVSSLAVQADGRILAGGNYTTLGGQYRGRIGRLNFDGTVDASFSPWANASVSCLAVQADGKILVGGGFSELSGQSRSCIGRLSTDGTVDASFNPGADFPVHCFALQADGRILVGGGFSELGGQRRGCIGRLNVDGTVDTSFNPEAGGYESFAPRVDVLTVQADGNILVGGWFATLSGQCRTNIGRLNADGTVDASFNPGVEDSFFMSPRVGSLAVQSDGKILVGGRFITLGGQSRTNIGRLNADGTVDASFNPGASDCVNSLALQMDGKILTGGDFSTLAGQSRRCIGRLNNTELATQALDFDEATITWLRGGTSPEVWRTTFERWNGNGWADLGSVARIAGGWRLTDLALPPDATLRARGYTAGGLFNGSAWFLETSLGPLVISHQPDSRTNFADTTAVFSVVAGGAGPVSYRWLKEGVPMADGENVTGVFTARLTLAGVWRADEGGFSVVVSNSFGSVTSVVARLTVVDPCIVTQPASQSQSLGGSATFTAAAAGTPPLSYQWRRNGIAIPGATWTSLLLTSIQAGDAGGYDMVVTNAFGLATSTVALLNQELAGANGDVLTLAQQPNGKILVGGSFTTLGGQSRSNIGRLNADGTVDASFSLGASSAVLCFVAQANSRIVVGGAFSALGGQSRSNIGRLNADGTVDGSFDPGADDSVFSLAAQADGKILVGGRFTTLGGQSRSSIGRLNANGTVDVSFSPEVRGDYAYVYSLAVQSDGKILVGGIFTMLGGQNRTNIGRLNADGTVDASFNPGADYYVCSLAPQADGKILVGGRFSALGGQNRRCIGRLNADGTLDTSFNPIADGIVRSLVLQADGTILVGGDFYTLGGQIRNCIGRLNADGTVDENFNLGSGGTSCVYSLAMQADGKILVGGVFTRLGGQSRDNIGRLDNTESAIQNLSFDGDTITWLRGGASPEILRTTFESWDGADWAGIGSGTRVAGGWQLTNISLPSNPTLRACGHMAGGGLCGSAWFVETGLGPLIISSQPVSRTNFAGTAAAFSVEVGGAGPVRYQWLKDGAPLTDRGNVQGAATSSLVLTGVQAGDAGRYSVVVSNAVESVTSLCAELTVVPMTLSVAGPGLGVTNGQFTFQIAGQAGLLHVLVEASTNLTDWSLWSTSTLSGSPLQVTVPADAGPARFYRVKPLP